MVFWYFCNFYKIIHLQVGVTIRLSSSGLTKICTFTPFYIVMNTSDVTMWVAEAKEEEDWIELPPKSVNRKNILSDQSQWINKTFIISKLAVTMFPIFFPGSLYTLYLHFFNFFFSVYHSGLCSLGMKWQCQPKWKDQNTELNPLT